MQEIGNILAAVNVKGGNVKPVEFIILEATSSSSVFLMFVQILLKGGTLCRGDIFAVDNCTIHMKADCIGIQHTLFEDYGVLMISLPPYHPEFNPTELVF